MCVLVDVDGVVFGAWEEHAVEFGLIPSPHTLDLKMASAEVFLHNQLALEVLAEEEVLVVVDSPARPTLPPFHIARALEKLAQQEAISTAHIITYDATERITSSI